MALVFKQYVYINGAGNNNTATLEELRNGSYFENKYQYITALGIRTMPGIQFSINQGLAEIGPSGVFDLRFPENFILKSLTFEDSLDTKIINTNGGYIIIDILGEEKEEE